MAAKKFPLSIVIRGVDKVTGPMRRINQRFARLGRRITVPFQRLGRSLSAMAKAAHLDGITRGFMRTRDGAAALLGKLGSITKKLALMSVAASIAGVALFRSFAKAGDNVAKVALKLGIGIEALQELRFAAERAGIPIRTFDMAMQRAGRRIGEAAAGTGEARPALNALGISVTDVTGKVRTLEDILPELADKLSKVESASVRNALAMKLFDSEGVMMVQMLAKGSKGIEEMRMKARELGLVISEDAARGTEKFQDAMINMMGSLSGVRNVIGTALLPSLTNLIRRLTDMSVGTQPRIQAWAEGFAKGLPARLSSLREWFGKVKESIKPLIDFGKRLTKRFGATEVAAAALGIILVGPLIGAIGQTVMGISFLIGSLLRTALVITMTVIPAVAKMAFSLLRTLVPAVFSVVMGVTTGLVMSLSVLATTIMTVVVPAVFAFTVALLANPITWVVLAIAGLVAAGIWLAKNWDAVGAKLKRVWGVITGAVGSAVESITGFFGGMFDWLMNKITSVGAWIGSKVRSLTSILPDWLEKALGVGGDVKVSVQAVDIDPARRAGSLDVQRQEQQVRVVFDDLPPGARVETDGDDIADLDVGMAMVTP